MDGLRVLQTIHIPGTLAANVAAVFTAPCSLTLVSVQAVGSNANDGKLEVGTTADTDAYLLSTAIGDSNVPVEVNTRAGFVGGEFPHIAKGTVVEVLLDFDGASGTAAANVTIVLTYVEG